MLRFRNNPRAWTILASTAAGAALLTGGWMWWSSFPPAPDDDPTQVVRFAATEDFAQLPAEEKQPYLDAMMNDPRKFIEAGRDANLTDEQRREAMGNVFMARAEAGMNAYFALEPGPAREAYLDKLIDEMDQRRAQWRSRASTRPSRGDVNALDRGRGRSDGAGFSGRGGGGRGRGGWGSAERMKNRMEKIPPATRAKFAEFRKAMRDRREARNRGR